MSGWDGNTVTYATARGYDSDDDNDLEAANALEDPIRFLREHRAQLETRLMEFVKEFRLDHDRFIYREQLQQNFHAGRHFLEIKLRDLHNYSNELANFMRTKPAEFSAIVLLDFVSR